MIVVFSEKQGYILLPQRNPNILVERISKNLVAISQQNLHVERTASHASEQKASRGSLPYLDAVPDLCKAVL